MGFFNLDNYEPGAERLKRFWEMHKDDGRVETELIKAETGHYIVRAKIFVGDRQVSTGLADEHTEAKGVNARNAMENCESSAIFRALANYIFPGKIEGQEQRPSREEMAKANLGAELGAYPIETNVTPLKFRTKTDVISDGYNASAEKRATPKQIGYLLSILDTFLGVQKRLDDKTGHNAFVRFALNKQDKRIVPDSNLTFADVRPLFDDHKAGHLGDNISAWQTGIPQSHQTAEIQAAGGEDDPWTTPGF